jgi:hypothetical protein
MTRTYLPSVLALAVLAVTTSSCSSDGFGRVRNPPRLVVELEPNAKTGAVDAPLPLLVGIPVPFKVTIRALAPDGSVDTTFNRYVRVSSKPGAVAALVGPDTDGRNVLLHNGESILIDVSITNAYGPTYIVADDLGYVPADPLRDPPPACSNGMDDDRDGLVDFPADHGCAFANDDSEEDGTYAEGASRTIYFKLPRIADIRGLVCQDVAGGVGCSGNGKTPYPREQILIDTGWHDDNTYTFNTVVTRLSADGFYAADLGDARRAAASDPPGSAGFSSVFAFNFNAPPRMRVCDRLKTYGGTANEFFGFTQISYPTWTLEEWDPAKRTCLVPAPERLTPTTIADTTELLRRSANLVRVETTPDKAQSTQVTKNFGPDDVPKSAGGAYIAGPNASNCDFDKNGKINSFTKGDPEGDCSTQCTADPTCTEYSNYLSRGTFRLTVTDSNGKSSAIQADASASAGFDPLALKGTAIRSFTGTMSFFSGGSQYTVEVRCKDDIVLDLKLGPFLDDFTCKEDKDCTPDRGLPDGFGCFTLADPAFGKACRRLNFICANDGDCTVDKGLPTDFHCLPLDTRAGTSSCRQRESDPPSIEPPPLACVFPRTFLENNPQ